MVSGDKPRCWVGAMPIGAFEEELSATLLVHVSVRIDGLGISVVGEIAEVYEVVPQLS